MGATAFCYKASLAVVQYLLVLVSTWFLRMERYFVLEPSTLKMPTRTNMSRPMIGVRLLLSLDGYSVLMLSQKQ